MTFETYSVLIYCWIAIAIIFFLILLKVTAPYGRHSSRKWGPQINNKAAWVIMESPGMAILLIFVLGSLDRQNLFSLILVGAYTFHYINRTFIFPIRIRTKSKKMPLVIMMAAILFNLANGFFLGYYFAHFADYPSKGVALFPVISGIILFMAGLLINWYHDTLLIRLRKPGETGYKIPHGGLFKYISCPNHFGEIIEWSGFALMCFNLPALAFLIWTAANLVPRALSHHRWYKNHFEEYPEERKAVIPFVL